MIRVAPLAVVGLLAVGTEAFGTGAILRDDDKQLLATYARDTWRSLDALAAVGPLPADGLWRAGDGWTPTQYTSPTNIAAYLWSTIAAESLSLIGRDESSRRLNASLAAIGRLERSHGFFYNWYDPRTGARLRSWPGGGPVRGFLSTVDNGWLAAGLMMVGRARPELRATTDALLAPMDFGFFYDPLDPANPAVHPGLLRGGFFPDGGGGAYADFHYGLLNTEPRIASYIGIARGDLPPEHYFRMQRSAPDPSAPSRPYRGVLVSEGARSYRGARVVPSWDGTMFEALMVPLFVPEAAWSPGSWGRNHGLYARAQIDYGLRDARLGFWGISASTDTRGGYQPFGIAPLGLAPDAGVCRDGKAPRVVTPHASFLAMPYAPREAIDNLKAMAAAFPIYSPFGFYDAVDVGTGRVAEGVLVLDQGMIMASIAAVLGNDVLQRAFTDGAVESAIRPLIEAEQFSVGDRPAASSVRSAAEVARPTTPAASIPSSAIEKAKARARIASVPPAPRRVLARFKPAPGTVVLRPLGSTDVSDSPGRPSPIRRKGGKPSDRKRQVS